MTCRVIVLTVAVAAATASAQSALLTDAELEPALAAAKQDRFQSLFVEARGRFGADFSLLLQGPIGRTMDLARLRWEACTYRRALRGHAPQSTTIWRSPARPSGHP